MKKNRKKSETYRYNGHPFLHSWSIHSVQIEELQARIKDFEAKLSDPNDPDDKKWIASWLSRFEQELAKKMKGLALKKWEKSRR